MAKIDTYPAPTAGRNAAKNGAAIEAETFLARCTVTFDGTENVATLIPLFANNSPKLEVIPESCRIRKGPGGAVSFTAKLVNATTPTDLTGALAYTGASTGPFAVLNTGSLPVVPMGAVVGLAFTAFTSAAAGAVIEVEVFCRKRLT
jgi:hypothetical protein